MGAYCRVRPLRTGDDEWTVHWSVFFPLGIKTRCSCEEGTCRCEVEWAGRCVVSFVVPVSFSSLFQFFSSVYRSCGGLGKVLKLIYGEFIA